MTEKNNIILKGSLLEFPISADWSWKH